MRPKDVPVFHGADSKAPRRSRLDDTRLQLPIFILEGQPVNRSPQLARLPQPRWRWSTGGGSPPPPAALPAVASPPTHAPAAVSTPSVALQQQQHPSAGLRDDLRAAREAVAAGTEGAVDELDRLLDVYNKDPKKINLRLCLDFKKGKCRDTCRFLHGTLK